MNIPGFMRCRVWTKHEDKTYSGYASTNIPGAEYIFSKWSKGGDSWEGEGTTPVGPEVALKSITFTVPKTTPAGTYRIYGGYLDVTHRSGGYEWLDKYAKFYRMEISDLTITVLKGDIETVEDLIDAIGANVTLDSEAAITAAKSAYDALSDEDKALVDADKVDATVQTAEVVNSTAVVTQTVAGNQAAIGYISMGSLDGTVKAVAVDGVEGTVENVKNGSYTVSRPFNICYKEEKLTDLGKDFVKFILSADGQAILGEKYIAVEGNAEAYTASGLTGNLSINGSTSVGPVMMELAEAYMNLNSGVTIDVQQTGSGAGITATMDGSCEIGMSSRDLKEEELAEGLTPVKIAMDGIAVIVNEANPVTGLTTEQIRNIFLGNTTNWSELG